MYNIRATLKESKIGGYLIQPEISIDEKDISILNVLLENSRLSCRQISKRTGYSISTVINRIKKLEESGIIRRYTLDIDFTKLGYDFPVIIDVRVSEGKLLEVEQEIAKNPHVIAVYDITGEFDVSVYARLLYTSPSPRD